ncbi:MAG: thylakoid membrane photosystem I accumulation factor [Geminocystis sp.]|nr:thylakoid membrane photosystem I accumulation factor [Geminocystis sp.]HIK38314.1 thylakoid membrane photosystem I accumulation factor [Geminocystis sp. M7585_C2015_104]MCS7148985.1 thylakoid membrane photosystem I accumulation factor [Geminocystis sp.]MCX8077375.1 thylakoid membrane photosystem I accumulation factor [Geminocystis sp.]MDW8114802.1 thylakoid membrane photosystem I accumulation factor [Geminocystis sp.]
MLASRCPSHLISFLLPCLLLIASFCLFPPAAVADLNNDRFDGNIFVVYAGNGSLVPPRLTLKQSLARQMPVILVYYLDDNSDCKKFAPVVSRLQEFYGRVASIIPVNVDSITMKEEYQPDEVGYYYRGAIPQTVILAQNGNKVFDEVGLIEFEQADGVLRRLFGLLPPTKSTTLKRESFNEFNSEFVGEN